MTLDHIRTEIEHMRVQIKRQQKDVLSLQRSGINTVSALALHSRNFQYPKTYQNREVARRYRKGDFASAGFIAALAVQTVISQDRIGRAYGRIARRLLTRASPYAVAAFLHQCRPARISFGETVYWKLPADLQQTPETHAEQQLRIRCCEIFARLLSPVDALGPPAFSLCHCLSS